MNQPSFVPTILTVKSSEELEKSVAHDLEQSPGKSISELLDEEKTKEKKETNQSKIERN